MPPKKSRKTRAANLTIPESLGTAVVESQDGLSPGGAADGAAARQGGDGGVVGSAILLRIEESVHQGHSGDADGEALRGFDLDLRQLGGAALLDVDLFFDGFDPGAQFADLLAQFAILGFEAVEAVDDLFQDRGRLGLDSKQRGQQYDDQSKTMAGNSHAIAAPMCPALRRGNMVWRSRRRPPAGGPEPGCPDRNRRSQR